MKRDRNDTVAIFGSPRTLEFDSTIQRLATILFIVLFENIRPDEVTIRARFGSLLKLIHVGVARGLDKDRYSTLEKDKCFDDMDN